MRISGFILALMASTALAACGGESPPADDPAEADEAGAGTYAPEPEGDDEAEAEAEASDDDGGDDEDGGEDGGEDEPESDEPGR